VWTIEQAAWPLTHSRRGAHFVPFEVHIRQVIQRAFEGNTIMASASGYAVNFLSRRLPGVTKWATRRQVARFRSTNGTRGNELAGSPVFVLDVVGRRSGKSRPVALMEVRDGDDLVVAGSNAGNPDTPNWYRNLMTAGHAYVEVGQERWAVTARQIDDDLERSRYWNLLVRNYTDFASYQQLTDRRIPVAVLTPQGKNQ
jgi:deazaflavin-dependent oxidoreductase (nitroreductase family)